MLKNPHIAPANALRVIVPLAEINGPVLMVWHMLPGQLNWLETAAVVELTDPPDADWLIEALPLIPAAIRQYHHDNKPKGGK
jgi:hypothetical protein